MAHTSNRYLGKSENFGTPLIPLIALKNRTDFIDTDCATSPRRLTAVNESKQQNIKPDILKRNIDSGDNF